MALPKIVRIQYNSDFTINCKLPKNYDNQDFIVRLYTTDKDDYYEASYRNGEYENCLTDGEYIVIYVNNHNLADGNLHIWTVFDYENNHFQDGVENISVGNSTNVYLVKNNPDATSAMYVGTALPDFTSSVDFVTQSDLEFELLNYYTKEEIDNASYISSADLNDYVTEEELNDMGFLSQSQLDVMGYTTKDYVDTKTSQKQDRLINGVNIKTVNGYSLLGNGNINISGVSQDDLDNAIAPLVSQEALTETLSYYVTNDSLNSMSYVTQSELNNMSYATQSFVDDAIADAFEDSDFMTETDVNNLLSTASYLTSTQLSAMGYITIGDVSACGYITNQDLEQTLSNATYVTSSELSNAGYATETYVSDYVAQHAPTPDLSAYVTKTELNNASYVTASALSNMSYATTNDLNTAISGITVPTKTSDLTNDSGFITSIPSEYVTESEIDGMGYVTSTELSNASYATTSQVNAKQDALVSGTNIKTINNESLLGSGNITITGGSSISEVTQAEYEAMQQAGTLDPNTIYVITDAAPTDLSYYVLQSDLENMGYVTSTALSNMSYATTSQLSNKQDTLVSGTNIKTINNNSLLGSGNINIQSGSTVTAVTQAQYDAMEQAGTLDSTVLYVITDAIGADLSDYVETSYLETYYADKTYVSDYVAQHAPTPDLSAYVTKTELSNASYVSHTELNSASYVTQNQLNNAGYLTSIPNTYATYTAISNMGYLTSANFIYDSSTYTLTISI